MSHSDPTLGPDHRDIHHRNPSISQNYDSAYHVSNRDIGPPSQRKLFNPKSPPSLSHDPSYMSISSRSQVSYETQSHTQQPRHSQTMSQPHENRDTSGLEYSRNNNPAILSRHRSDSSFSYPSPQPWISTSMGASTTIDDERTPVARFNTNASYSSVNPGPQDESLSGSASKYECAYCGKGFSRPSSLKVLQPFVTFWRACSNVFFYCQIHLNSHTGEKRKVLPFCPCTDASYLYFACR